MTQQFAIEANITKAHKETLGFEYETRLVTGILPWGSANIAMYVEANKDQLPKKFNNEIEASTYIKKLKKYSKTDKHIKIIDFSIVVYK